MPTKSTAVYGSWPSPITADLITEATISLVSGAYQGDDVYWVEGRPTQGGRLVLVRRTPDGKITDLTPPAYNVRTRVHEYGGGAHVVDHGTIYFSNFADQRLYWQSPGGEPQAITPPVDLRYADGVLDRRRRRLICVREDHTRPDGQIVNTIAGVPLRESLGGEVLISGNDFYAYPRLNADGTRLAWQTWNHPNMPWDGSELWLGEMRSDGSIGERTLVAGGPNESVFQPLWSPDGGLYFVSDRTGWWNLYRWNGRDVEPLCPRNAEFGVPQWRFGAATYALASPDQLVCSYREGGRWNLATLDTRTLRLEQMDLPYTEISDLSAGSGRALFIGGSASRPQALISLKLATRETTVLRRAFDKTIDSRFISAPQEIEFPTEGGLTAYGYFYRPQNPDVTAPHGELPPLIVLSHGGPTGSTSANFNLGIQFWTTRGFAVLDVNYGGSTGYGRAYRERLNGQWGLVDMDDCANGARYLVQQGLVNPKHLAIRGGSAGGYTTLCALTFRDVFTAGASHFGISDLEVFVRDTHKFESRYLDRLVGPYPERKDLYHARSALNYLDRLSCPLILFQGLEDKIVPPNQAQMMFEAVKAKGLPVAYLAFEGEQHGFRQAKNIKRSLEAELYFYSKVFGFPLAEAIEPVQILNLNR